jgi:hypothetical protein
LSIVLVIAIGLISWNTYASWKAGPWDLPTPAKSSAPLVEAGKQKSPPVKLVSATDAIVNRNLFDPERGAGATRDAEESSRSAQRIRNLILLGTVVIGDNRTAVVQDGSTPGAAGGQAAAPMRLKVGDNMEGYTLAEIGERKVVFTKNTARVELALDYFRKVEVPAPRRPAAPGQAPPQPGSPTPPASPAAGVAPSPPAVPGPRVIPNLPRRGRVPLPENPNPQS